MLLQAAKDPVVRARAAEAAVAAAAELGDQRAAGTALQVALDALAATDSDFRAFSAYHSIIETCWKRQLVPEAKRVLAVMAARQNANDDKSNGTWYRVTAELHSRFQDWDPVVAAIREGVRRRSGVIQPAPLLIAASRLPDDRVPAIEAIVNGSDPDNLYAAVVRIGVMLRGGASDIATWPNMPVPPRTFRSLIESIQDGDIPKTDAVRKLMEREYRQQPTPSGPLPVSAETPDLVRAFLDIGWTDLAVVVARRCSTIRQLRTSPRYDALSVLIHRAQYEPTSADLAGLIAEEQSALLARTGAMLIAAGNFDRATTFLSKVEPVKDRDPFFDSVMGFETPWTIVASAWATRGDVARALEAARREDDEVRRDQAAREVAVIFASQVRASDADAAIALIKGDTAASAARADVVVALARGDHAAMAEQRLTGIHYPDDQARAIAAVAMAKAGSEGLYRASRMAARCASVKYRIRAYTSIVLTYAARLTPEYAEVIAGLQRRLRGPPGA